MQVYVLSRGRVPDLFLTSFIIPTSAGEASHPIAPAKSVDPAEADVGIMKTALFFYNIVA